MNPTQIIIDALAVSAQAGHISMEEWQAAFDYFFELKENKE